MTINTPLRCAHSAMASGDGYTWLMDTGNYPSFSSYLNETWEYNGTTNTWINTAATLFDANGPLPGRSQQVMSFDGTNIMLYGGQGGASGQVFQDTWTFNGTAWSQKSPATVPFGRYGAKSAYLAGTGTVMFGGFGGAGNGVYLLETWVWNGTTWALQVIANGASPHARVQHCMAASGSLAVMFGGVISSGEFLNDTWTFAAGAWTKQAATNAPSVRGDACMTFDVANGNFVLFGGQNEYNYLPETWTLNAAGTAWTKQAPTTSPSGRVGAQMCYDTNLGAVVMFGGITATDNYPSNATWAWSGTNWILK